MSHVIRGDNIVIQNVRTGQDVTLRHEKDGFKLMFQSECVFQSSSTHNSLKIGDFTVQLSTDKAELLVKKNENTVFRISE